MAEDEEGEHPLVNDTEEETEEKWLKHYSSLHQILLVAEGDFSFSVCLALSFASATNIVPSSLDSYDDVIKKYKKAKSNLEILEKLGATPLYGVDATKMKHHPDIKMRKFDRIIFNFPHAGFYGKEDNVIMINMHKNLVNGFFSNASGMLKPNGEIHVSHKTTHPFCHWNLEELASWNSLDLIERVDFKIEDYPGYNNKRGSSPRCDGPFPLGESRTFKFRFSPAVKKMPIVRRNLDLPYRGYRELQESPILRQHQPIPFMNGIPGKVGSPPTFFITNECFRIFNLYFTHVLETFGRTENNVGFYVHEALGFGLERYLAEDAGRPLTGYINLLQELHRLSMFRSARLRMMLLAADSNL